MLDDLGDRPPLGTWLHLALVARYVVHGATQMLVLSIEVREQFLGARMHVEKRAEGLERRVEESASITARR
jgi:hypothetical protein